MTTLVVPEAERCCPVCGGLWQNPDVCSTTDGIVYYKGKRLDLPKKAHAVFSCLMEHMGKPVSKDVLWDRMYSSKATDHPNIGNISVYILTIRRTIESCRIPFMIKTVWGVGWILCRH